jgi:2-(1,2-epoxy-1,2-dihydrophenyl)acetyl-CoA isomerase
MEDVSIHRHDGFVVTVEMHRGENTFFDATLIRHVADAVLELEIDPSCRAIVLASGGKHFCAGADLGDRRDRARPRDDGVPPAHELYDQGLRLFTGSKPIVAAIRGAAIGGGLGVALAADFRVASPESRFSANFARLGFFPGFGITHTLEAVVGHQRALDLLYTGRRIGGEEAFEIGLCDRLVATDEIRSEALAFAREIAASGPLSVPTLRRHLRGHLVGAVRDAMGREAAEQTRLLPTADFAEGIRAMAERRPPVFGGH